MNNRAELEIAINKRWLERGLFLLVIAVLAVLLYQRWDAPQALTAQATLEEELSLLQAQNQNQVKQNELDMQTTIVAPNAEVENEGSSTRDPTSNPIANPVPQTAILDSTQANNTTAVKSEKKLSGAFEVDWVVLGTPLAPTDYNKDELAKLATQKSELEKEIAHAEDDKKSDLREDLRDVEAEIRKLSVGENKYRLNAVSIKFENGLAQAKAVEYTVCWSFLDCYTVKNSGKLTVESGESLTIPLDLRIPTLVTLDKDYYSLKLRVTEGATQIAVRDFRLQP